MLPALKPKKFISEYHYRIDHFFSDNVDNRTDFYIYLPKYFCNLQRDYCWDDLQKQELINSILLQRHIPPITVVEYTHNYFKKDIRNSKLTDKEFFKPKNQLIDGKQRLLTHNKFINNEFSIEINGNKYFFKQLPKDYQNRITYHEHRCIIIKYDNFGDASDDDLVDLFKWCNFAGTQQEKDYLDKFK